MSSAYNKTILFFTISFNALVCGYAHAGLSHRGLSTGSVYSFGDHTLAGNGGLVPKGLSGALTILSETDSSGGPSTDFVVNTDYDGTTGQIVPAGTYNAAGPTYKGPYKLSVSGTGGTVNLTINIDPNEWTVKSQYGFATHGDTASINQLKNIVENKVLRGDTIVQRDGSGATGIRPEFNPYNLASARYFLVMPSVDYAVRSGTTNRFITVTCETQYKNLLDTNGNPVGGGACGHGGIVVSTVSGGVFDIAHTSNALPSPLDFQFYTLDREFASTTDNSAGCGQSSCVSFPSQLAASSGLGAYGVQCHNCRFILGPAISKSEGGTLLLTGMTGPGLVAVNSHFIGHYTSNISTFNPGLSLTEVLPLTISGNIIEGTVTDAFDIIPSVYYGTPTGYPSPAINDNFSFNYDPISPGPLPDDVVTVNGHNYLFQTMWDGVANAHAVNGGTYDTVPIGSNITQALTGFACVLNGGGSPIININPSPYASLSCSPGVNYAVGQTPNSGLTAAAYYISGPQWNLLFTGASPITFSDPSSTTLTANLTSIAPGSANCSGPGAGSYSACMLIVGSHSDTLQWNNMPIAGDASYVGVEFARNFAMRGTQPVNGSGTQFYFGNLAHCCIYNSNIHNNIGHEAAGNIYYLQGHGTPTVQFNTGFLAAETNVYAPNDVSYADPPAYVYGGNIIGSATLVTLKGGTATGGGGTFSNNLINNFSVTSATQGTPLTLANNEAIVSAATISGGVQSDDCWALSYTFTNPPPGTALCKTFTTPSTVLPLVQTAPHNRSQAIAAFTPARGTTFTGLSISGVSAPTQTATVTAIGVTFTHGEVLNCGPNDGTSPLPYGAVVTTGGVGSATVKQYGMSNSSGPFNCGTGAMNFDGTYNGALFPLDDAGTPSYNDGTVFVPSATHTPAQ